MVSTSAVGKNVLGTLGSSGYTFGLNESCVSFGGLWTCAGCMNINPEHVFIFQHDPCVRIFDSIVPK